jgi:hypothetical protein
MARQSHIPIEFIQVGFLTGKQRLHRFVIQLKMTEGFRIHDGVHSRELLNLTHRAGLITRCAKTGHYYQKSWRSICKNYKSVTRVTIDHQLWKENSFQDIAYLAVMAYLVCLQEKRKPYGNLKKYLKASAHNGGISHSLISAFFGKNSKAWSFNRRRSCEKSGLLKFKRRWRREPLLDKVPACDDPFLDGCFNTHNGVGREITSFVTFKVAVDTCIPSYARIKGLYGK